MKIVCRNCGKKYDYDECIGICPKCGKYIPSTSGQSTVVTGSNASRKKHKQEHIFSNKNHEGLIRNIIIIMIVIICLVGYPLIRIPANQKDMEEFLQSLSNEDLDEATVAPEESFEINGIMLTVSKLQEYAFGDDVPKAPKGWKYMMCEYYYDDPEDDYVNPPQTEVYLHYEDDSYLAPTTVYTISDDEEVWEKYQTEIQYALNQEQGKIVFMIPEDITEASLEIYEKRDVSESDGEYYQKVKCIYRIPFKMEESK